MKKCILVVFLILLAPIVCVAEEVSWITYSYFPYIVEITISEYFEGPREVIKYTDSYVVREQGEKYHDPIDLKNGHAITIRATTLDEDQEPGIVVMISLGEKYTFSAKGWSLVEGGFFIERD